MFYTKRITWALRKARLPVVGSGLVLDVGSGGNPYTRSDILLDRLTGAEHRCGVSMMIDRPAVFGDASKMPFKDKVFDFVVASHILEHMSDPVSFLNELQRVGKSGYIETPNFLFERLFPYDIHCLEIALVNGVLHIHKKARPVEDDFIGSLDYLKHDSEWKKLFFEAPSFFHVRYYWNNEIKYLIHNPEISSKWIEKINSNSNEGEIKKNYLQGNLGWRKWGLWLLGFWHSYRRASRLKNFDLLKILACPECKGDLQMTKDYLVCNSCKVKYKAGQNPDFCNPL
ncbi:methyltransferase domain-containing protein [Limnohabitans sp. WS1]|uniref:methyltransferase domain-containing protein n=1 Tax=Limnohabitans sp. WS1 TaxID=1100726 RepID=UPI000D3BE028|nr:methyltransferase domain-containing protein [Limnohabitans sp. WS1]PUE17942.1 hypothetical protein B9Z48_10175 [Limnohabitans sp. WS1]